MSLFKIFLEATTSRTPFPLLSSPVSSSDVLGLRRTPTRAGDGGFFAGSASRDFGLYFGSPEFATEFLGRSVEARGTVVLGVVFGLGTGDEGSSEDVAPVFLTVEILFAPLEIVFSSGVVSFSLFAALSVARVDVGARLIALERRDVISFVFLPVFSFSFSALVSFVSLCITSAMALPTDERLRECRIELRVVGRGRRVTPLLAALVVDMSGIYNVS